MRLPVLGLALLVVPAVLVAPAAGHHHDSTCPEYAETWRLPEGVLVEWSTKGFVRLTLPHDGRLYYLTLDEANQVHTYFGRGGGVWLYEETNDMAGLQRHDSFCYEPVPLGYTQDTVIL